MLIVFTVASELGLARSLPANTKSMATWSTIEGWLRECSDQHQCPDEHKAGQQWYPTRLIELVTPDSFRVIHSDSERFQKGKGYLTLSHRWGDSKFLQLTTDKVADFERGLPTTSLRRTFQDALTIAQRLDKYIWIDSLCIIQSGDFGADWRKECTTMAQVYSNSFCNISADWGNDEDGLFFQRDDKYSPCHVRLRWKVSENTSSNPRSKSSPEVPYCIVQPNLWHNEVVKSPLNCRGWVLQERLLAPRALHFSPQQISWECGQSWRCEILPSPVSTSAMCRMNLDGLKGKGFANEELPQSPLREPRRLCVTDGEIPTSDRRSLLDWWSEVVKDYMACQLTKRSDRLVAIAGVARELGPILRDRYAVGLWAQSLPWSLTWSIGSNDTKRCTSAECYVPTFSWAKVPCDSHLVLPSGPPVRPYKCEDRAIASAAFVHYRRKTSYLDSTARQPPNLDDEILKDDVFGPVTSPEAEVRIQGFLRSCRRMATGMRPAHFGYAFPATSHEEPAPVYDLLDFDFDKEPQVELEVLYDCPLAEDAETDSTIYYYVMITWTGDTYSESSVTSENYLNVQGLFLTSVDASAGRFERIGHVTDSSIGANALRPLGNERDLPCWSYNEETGKHTFYVV